MCVWWLLCTFNISLKARSTSLTSDRFQKFLHQGTASLVRADVGACVFWPQSLLLCLCNHRLLCLCRQYMLEHAVFVYPAQRWTTVVLCTPYRFVNLWYRPSCQVFLYFSKSKREHSRWKVGTRTKRLLFEVACPLQQTEMEELYRTDFCRLYFQQRMDVSCVHVCGSHML